MGFKTIARVQKSATRARVVAPPVDQIFSPITSPLTLTGYAPDFQGGSFTPSPGTLTLTGFVPTWSPPLGIAGLKGWFDVASLSALNDGDPVTTWPDWSGLGNDLAGTGAARPLYKIVAGQPVVQFDGSDDVMLKGGLLATFATNLTTFSVMRTIGAGEANGRLLTIRQDDAYTVFTNGTHPLATFAFYNPIKDTGVNTATLAIVTVRITNASTGAIWINGGSHQAFDPGIDNTGFGDVFIGSAHASGIEASNSEHCAHVFFDPALSDADCQTVERFLGQRFGVSVP